MDAHPVTGVLYAARRPQDGEPVLLTIEATRKYIAALPPANY